MFDLGDSGFSNNYMINLTSELFNNPLDLLFLLFGNDNTPLGGFCLEDSYVVQHQMTLTSTNAAVVENVGILASRIISLNV
jgi:hypothetical protein